MRRTTSLSVLITLVALLVARGAIADEVSKGVQKAFQGKILISDKPLPLVEDDKAAIKQYRELDKKSLSHGDVEGVPSWTFHYTAFLKQAPKINELSLDFYTADKEKLYVANKRFTGIDPALKVLEGNLTMNEDDNLNAGRTYDLKLVGKVKGREVVFATTRVTFK